MQIFFRSLKRLLKRFLLAVGLLGAVLAIIRAIKIISRAIKVKIIKIVVHYNDPDQKKAMEIVYRVSTETDMLLTLNEAYEIFTIAKRTSKIEGNIAEVGTYSGGSSKLICEAKGNKSLHLFDTFDGLPELTNHDDSVKFSSHQFAASYEKVKEYLKNYPNVKLYKGLFPNTAGPIKDLRFSFVHLDVDLWGPTRDCLEFFYPRMNKGGVILSHDYPTSIGVKKAFDEFFCNKPEIIIELGHTQCMVVKL